MEPTHVVEIGGARADALHRAVAQRDVVDRRAAVVQQAADLTMTLQTAGRQQDDGHHGMQVARHAEGHGLLPSEAGNAFAIIRPRMTISGLVFRYAVERGQHIGDLAGRIPLSQLGQHGSGQSQARPWLAARTLSSRISPSTSRFSSLKTGEVVTSTERGRGRFTTRRLLMRPGRAVMTDTLSAMSSASSMS